MNNSNSPAAPEITVDTTKCPGCGGQFVLAAKRCPHCGRPTARLHGFFYYAFWVGLSLIVAALIACIFYEGFLLVNRML
jgi:predicted amidophosphoribosyltransferase